MIAVVMYRRSIEEAVKLLRENSVRWVHSAFVDVRGIMHDIVVPAREYIEGDAFKYGVGFDGSSVRGFRDVEESDMVLIPDPRTLAVIPWIGGELQRSAIVLGDVYESYGEAEPSEVCPRGYVAKRAERMSRDLGFDAFIGAEMEHFVFKSVDPTKLVWDLWVSPKGYTDECWGAPRILPESPEITPGGYILKPKDAYLRPPPEDTTLDYRNEVASILEDSFGFRIERHHHEVATAGQVEVNFRFGKLVETADRVVYYKFVAKNIARMRGLIATFMPKPVYLDNASGMHIHASLWIGDRNIMYDSSDSYAELSQEARYFIGGLLDHARALTAVCCPTVNSYKRLVPGFEAPIYIMWSKRNRSALVRIPMYLRGGEYASYKRIEYRAADPSCNPYLAFSCILAAGLDGVRKKIDPGDPVDENVYKLTDERRRALGIRELPSTLKEALEEMECDEIIHQTLGSHIFDKFIEYKMEEWRQYSMYITPWEIVRYLDC